MPSLYTIEQTSRWITACLWVALLVQQIRWQNFWYIPYFTIYLILSCIQTVWSPHGLIANLFIEPSLMSLRFCCAIEAVSLCLSPIRGKERRWILITMLLIGVLIMAVLRVTKWSPWESGIFYYLSSNPLLIYVTARQYFHVALALACVMGATAYTIERVKMERWPRNHFLILTLHFLVISAIGFINVPDWRIYPQLYREVHIWYYFGTAICLSLWIRLRAFLF